MPICTLYATIPPLLQPHLIILAAARCCKPPPPPLFLSCRDLCVTAKVGEVGLIFPKVYRTVPLPVLESRPLAGNSDALRQWVLVSGHYVYIRCVFVRGVGRGALFPCVCLCIPRACV